jgi:GNAT superfamily N-acetyltransferase
VTTDRAAPVLRVRTPEAGDVPALHDFLSAGIAGYRAFAPPDWVPPLQSAPAKIERTLSELADPRTYSRMAELDGRIAGFVHRFEPDPPVDVRLRYLFVAEPFWGTGLAQELHDGSVAAMRARTARLFTPVAHARARRFYEHRGWRLHDVLDVSPLGLPVAEYRRPRPEASPVRGMSGGSVAG